MAKKNVYYREVKQGIPSLVDDKGMFNFGTYNQPIPKINMLDAKRPLGFRAPRWYKKFRLKEWEAFQAGNKDVFIFGAVYNAKANGYVLLAVYDRRNEKFYNYEKIMLSFKIKNASGLFNSVSVGEAKNYYLAVKNNLEKDEIYVEGKIGPQDDLPVTRLNIKAYHTGEPIVICQPFAPNRALYSHKNLMPMEGFIAIGDEQIQFDKDDARMVLDDHKGYYPYEMKYDWVTGFAKDEEGNDFGFNLTDNQILNHEKYNENCLWLNGKMNVLPPIKVERFYEKEEKWHITDKYGMVNLWFYPEPKAFKEVKLNLLVVRSDYEAPMGRFKGYFQLKDKKINVENCFGMGEKKKIRV
ncbi:MAG: DUF2804 domain-containing protein [Dethiobacteria bacterium]